MSQFGFGGGVRAITLAAALVAVLSMSAAAGEKFSQARPVELKKDGRRWAERTLKKMSLEEKVGQMVQVRYWMDFQNFAGDSYRQFREQLQKYHIGSVLLTVRARGLVLRKDLPLEAASMANQMQRDSRLPLLVAADFERGLYSRLDSVPLFPDAMAFGAAGKIAYAERFGAITAQESRAVGIHWNLFPVADVNSNPANPIINTRSFGEDPDQVGALVAAFIQGSRAHGMLTTAKHFPGHGDTGSDTHLGVARVEGNLERLEKVELVPFRRAIAAGVDSIMVGHVAVPAVEPDINKIASVSGKVVTGLARDGLGFQGVIISDALDMGGVTSLYPAGARSATAQAAVEAIKAGNDVVVAPGDLPEAFDGIVDAVRGGEISQPRIDASVRRVLELKASLRLHKARLVDLEQVPHRVSKPEAMQFAQAVAEAAVTLVRHNGTALPLPQARPALDVANPGATQLPREPLLAIVISDTVSGGWGHVFEAALRERHADAIVFRVDNTIAGPLTPQIVQAAKDAERVVVAAYIVPTAGKRVMVNGRMANSISLEQASGELLRRVLEVAASKTVVVALGSPYLVQSFPGTQTYLCTFSNAASSEISAVKALFGELESHGKLPVTLPGVARRGFSLPWPSPRESAASGR